MSNHPVLLTHALGSDIKEEEEEEEDMKFQFMNLFLSVGSLSRSKSLFDVHFISSKLAEDLEIMHTWTKDYHLCNLIIFLPSTRRFLSITLLNSFHVHDFIDIEDAGECQYRMDQMYIYGYGIEGYRPERQMHCDNSFDSCRRCW